MSLRIIVRVIQHWWESCYPPLRIELANLIICYDLLTCFVDSRIAAVLQCASIFIVCLFSVFCVASCTSPKLQNDQLNCSSCSSIISSLVDHREERDRYFQKATTESMFPFNTAMAKTKVSLGLKIENLSYRALTDYMYHLHSIWLFQCNISVLLFLVSLHWPCIPKHYVDLNSLVWSFWIYLYFHNCFGCSSILIYIMLPNDWCKY